MSSASATAHQISDRSWPPVLRIGLSHLSAAHESDCGSKSPILGSEPAAGKGSVEAVQEKPWPAVADEQARLGCARARQARYRCCLLSWLHVGAKEEREGQQTIQN